MKIYGLLFFLVFCAGHGYAVNVNASVTNEEFGRLFTTPAERQALDKLRKEGKLSDKTGDNIETIEPPNTPVKANPPIKMSGILLRADGKTQIWLSGKPVSGKLKIVAADKQYSAELRAPVSAKSVLLKPGQVLSKGKATESYYFVTTQSSVATSSIQAVAIPVPVINTQASASSSSQANEHAQSSKH